MDPCDSVFSQAAIEKAVRELVHDGFGGAEASAFVTHMATVTPSLAKARELGAALVASGVVDEDARERVATDVREMIASRSVVNEATEHDDAELADHLAVILAIEGRERFDAEVRKIRAELAWADSRALARLDALVAAARSK